MGKKALIIGSSGLVGTELLHILLEQSAYDEIRIFVRSSLHIQHNKLTEVIVDFDRLVEYKEYFAVDDIFCCMGTTIKKAKTQENMIKIDVDYPVTCAELGLKMGAKQFLVISSMGANSKSSVFYSRMKGILEEKLKAIGFPTLHILRPSLLLGNRKEFRFGEKASSYLMPLFHFLMVGPFKKYRAIKAITVAKAMGVLAQMNKNGTHIFLSNEIRDIARN